MWLCGRALTNTISPKYLKDNEAAQQGVNFKLSCIAEGGTKNFILAKSVGILVNDLLGQNLALIYVIPGVR